MSEQNPTMLYKHPGRYPMHGSHFDTKVVDQNDTEAWEEALADGWCETTDQALGLDEQAVDADTNQDDSEPDVPADEPDAPAEPAQDDEQADEPANEPDAINEPDADAQSAEQAADADGSGYTTKDEIMAKLDELGVKYKKRDSRDVLLGLLNDALNG